MGEVHDFVE